MHKVPLSAVVNKASALDYIPLPMVVYLPYVFLKFWVMHPKTTTTVALFFWFWWSGPGMFWVLAFLFMFGIVSAIFTVYIVVLIAISGWNGWAHFFQSAYRIAIVKFRWSQACYNAALVGRRSKDTPKMRFLMVTPRGVKGRVRAGRLGIPIDKIEKEGIIQSLMASMGASSVRVRKIHEGLGWVELTWADAITNRIIRSGDVPLPEFGNLTRVNFGKDDDDQIVSLAPDRSLLLVGESGSGKSGVLWALIKGLGDSGTPHRLHVSDAKGGVELSQLREYEKTAGYAVNFQESERMIADVVKQMFKTYDRMRKDRVRKVRVSEEYPLHIIVIDELLLLKKLLKEGENGPIGQLLSQGRAAGFAVWACSQLAQKDVIGPVRDLFVQRICMAVRSADLTDAVLGQGAEAEGAKCSQISPNTRGIGYMYDDESDDRSYRRFRAVYIEDEEIADIIGMVTVRNGERTEKPDWETDIITD